MVGSIPTDPSPLAAQLLGIADLSCIPKTPLRFEEQDAIRYFRQLQNGAR
ncbi:MAG: hypothetical protein U0905_08725 [Pirellulales bacterium]